MVYVETNDVQVTSNMICQFSDWIQSKSTTSLLCILQNKWYNMSPICRCLHGFSISNYVWLL